MTFHSKASLGARHPIHNFEYANAAARTGATGLVADDDGKIALQTDDNTLWLLSDYSGPTWKQVNSQINKPSLTKTITVEDPGAAESIIMFRTDVAITIVEMKGILKASGSVTVRIAHDTTYSGSPNYVGAATAVTGTTETNLPVAGDNDIPANSWIWFTTTASATPQTVSVDIRYTEN